MRAKPALRRVTGAERRFSVSLAVNEVTMLAASDELAAATRDAMDWMAVNSCPDVDLGARVAQMLKICAEVALTAQRAIFDPSADKEAIIGRLGALLAVIDLHSQTLEDW